MKFDKNIIKNKLLCKLCKEKDAIFTYHVRPQKAEDYEVKTVDLTYGKKVCILLQGNICYKYNFTYETLKLYRKLYPNCLLVLSTWNNENRDLLKKIKDLGVHVIESATPSKSGHGNINFQLTSTNAGIEYALSQNVDYILKSRTDQRLCSEMNITYMMDILKEYPIHIAAKGVGRIVVCSNGCFSNRLYNVTDMLLFGKSNDIHRYFDAPYDERCGIDYSQEDPIEYSKNRPGEIYLSTHYIENLGFDLKWTEDDSNYYIKELFAVIDSASLDWVWLKYTMREYRYRKYKDNNLIPFTHKEWLRLYLENANE